MKDHKVAVVPKEEKSIKETKPDVKSTQSTVETPAKPPTPTGDGEGRMEQRTPIARNSFSTNVNPMTMASNNKGSESELYEDDFEVLSASGDRSHLRFNQQGAVSGLHRSVSDIRANAGKNQLPAIPVEKSVKESISELYEEDFEQLTSSVNAISHVSSSIAKWVTCYKCNQRFEVNKKAEHDRTCKGNSKQRRDTKRSRRFDDFHESINEEIMENNSSIVPIERSRKATDQRSRYEESYKDDFEALSEFDT
eukprot:TRINITY_DN18078_c0_g1_i1.p1 TRINITY_DN18078_c0_g1~~TRINITY_DN18078_c0_g1_i1.p1  ORF type:complete len:252 (-),score=52.78 TRINITY_DN18078_c0_g1_i1:96-851(-)